MRIAQEQDLDTNAMFLRVDESLLIEYHGLKAERVYIPEGHTDNFCPAFK
jgi:hypothetical protein